MNKKLKIGITPLESKLFGTTATSIINNYIAFVRSFDCIPIIMLPNPTKYEMEALYTDLDVIILQGGHDINPFLYNEPFLAGLKEVNDNQDKTDFAYLSFAIEHNIKVLGVCRGMQVINVYFGGSLFQDVKYMPKKTNVMHDANDSGLILPHEVEIIENNSFTKSFFEHKNFPVNSLHHQMINRLGKDVIKTMICPTDGVIEGIEVTKSNCPLIIGFQFHPEIMIANRDSRMQEFFINFLNA